MAKQTKAFTGFGPGKVILLGEHGVVYGQPALAAPLSWGVTATGVSARKCELVVPSKVRGNAMKLLRSAFDKVAKQLGRPAVRVTLASDLPLSVGLGSSAAVSVACARLLLAAAGREAKPDQVLRLALDMEREFHGTPSGVDHTCCAYGALISYQRAAGLELGRATVLQSPKPLKLLVALVGPRTGTLQTVLALRARQERWPERYGRFFSQMGALVRDAKAAIGRADFEALGDAMNLNHGLLAGLGLSSPSIDSMVHRLRAMGALGAKLTGAGGDGGAVIGLFLEPEPIVARLSREGVYCFGSQIAGPRAL